MFFPRHGIQNEKILNKRNSLEGGDEKRRKEKKGEKEKYYVRIVDFFLSIRFIFYFVVPSPTLTRTFVNVQVYFNAKIKLHFESLEEHDPRSNLSISSIEQDSS